MSVNAYKLGYESGESFGYYEPEGIDRELNAVLGNPDLFSSRQEWNGYVAGLRAAKARQADNGA